MQKFQSARGEAYNNLYSKFLLHKGMTNRPMCATDNHASCTLQTGFNNSTPDSSTSRQKLRMGGLQAHVTRKACGTGSVRALKHLHSYAGRDCCSGTMYEATIWSACTGPAAPNECLSCVRWRAMKRAHPPRRTGRCRSQSSDLASGKKPLACAADHPST